MDQKLRRLTIRHLNHSGAISLDWLIQQDGAQYDRIQLQNVLLASGFEQANDDWLVAGSDLSRPRDKSNVFHNSLCKMFAFCGPLGLADIMGGLEHALSKTDFPIPSASILSAVLGRGGYTLDGDKWCFEGTFDATLNRGEKVIMRTIVGNGHVAHHSQLAHAVISSSLSFPSLHATLTRSPLFAKFERSLYKLRGSTPSQTAIEQCMQAHGQVRVNLRSDYDLDGNIVIEASLGTLAIGNGTVTSERLPNLAGEWLYSSDEGIENAIVATSNEIRGLRTAFESLGCRVGDRIRLVFSTDHRRVALSKDLGVSMTIAPNRHFLTIAVGNLGGHERQVHTEDVALEADKLVPGRFAWRKYPHRIDINVVLQGLGDARRSRYDAHVAGSNVKGWMLSAAGQIWIKRLHANDSPGLARLVSDARGSLIAGQRMETSRLRETEAFALFSSGNRTRLHESNSITLCA